MFTALPLEVRSLPLNETPLPGDTLAFADLRFARDRPSIAFARHLVAIDGRIHYGLFDRVRPHRRRH